MIVLWYVAAYVFREKSLKRWHIHTRQQDVMGQKFLQFSANSDTFKTASVVRVLGYRSGGPGSIPDTTKKVVGLERGPLSLVSTTEKLLDRKVEAPVYKTENTAVGIRHADHVEPSIRKSWQSLRRQAAVARSV
jgi:hypothetical protein